MKIATTIPIRRDGTVRVHVSGATYVFKRDDSGHAVADVPEEHAAMILDHEQFFQITQGESPEQSASVPEIALGKKSRKR